MKNKTGKMNPAKRQPPVTLAGLSFEDAVAGLLAVKHVSKKKATGKKKG